MIDLATLIIEVRLMRELQKEYFRTRSGDVLTKCKQQERKVDELLANDGQDSLFDRKD